MTGPLTFWFDYTCPYAYLASTQAEVLAGRMGVDLEWAPMLLGGVFRANGTAQRLFETLSPAKARHNAEDMARWARLFGVELTMPSGHPYRSVEALRATLLAGRDPAVIHGFYRAYWVENRPVSDPDTLRRVLATAGHDPGAILARLDEQAVKDDLRARTDRAIALGIFGAPSWVARGEMYWGQDRMHFVLGRDVDWIPGLRPEEGYVEKKTHTLEVFWDFSSPFAYLGSTQVEALAARTGATVVWRPMLLGGVFKDIGQVDAPILTWSDAKRRYYLEDLQRWAAYWGVPFRFPSRFPMASVKALRAYLALPEARQRLFRERTFDAYWAEDRDISDDAVLADLLGDDGREVLARTQDKAIKDALIGASKEAVARGVFGAPTFVVDGKDLFWGQDRLALVERALTA